MKPFNIPPSQLNTKHFNFHYSLQISNKKIIFLISIITQNPWDSDAWTMQFSNKYFLQKIRAFGVKREREEKFKLSHVSALHVLRKIETSLQKTNILLIPHDRSPAIITQSQRTCINLAEPQRNKISCTKKKSFTLVPISHMWSGDHDPTWNDDIPTKLYAFADCHSVTLENSASAFPLKSTI